LVRIEQPDPVTGARKRVTVGTFATKRQAEKEEAKAITARERGTLLAPDTTTVGELLDRWLEVDVPRSVRPEQIVNYEGIVRLHLKPAFGEVQVRRLTVERVESLYADLQTRGYSTSLIRNVHLRLSAALKLGKRWGLVAENVCDIAKPPTLSYRQSKIWTAEETAAFLEAAEGDPLATYWRLAIETGARTSELLGLTWDDVDLERRTLRIGEHVVRNLHGVPFVKEGGKTTAARRTIGLTAFMADVLREHRRQWAERKIAATSWEDPYGLVFSSPRGRPLNSRNVRRTFDRLVKIAGVTSIPPHSLRKGHITSAIAAGGNLRAVQGRVGHSDPATTLGIYTALTAGMEASLMDVVETLVPRRDRDAG
jgi:integrase